MYCILRFADTAAILILPPGQAIMNIEINCSQRNILISIIIMGYPGGKINMVAVFAKRSMSKIFVRFLLFEKMLSYIIN